MNVRALTRCVWLGCFAASMAGSVVPVRAQATSAAELARTCKAEANVQADDPRYGIGFCLIYLRHTLSVLRNSDTCAPAIDGGNVDAQAIAAFVSGVQAHPDMGSQDAELAAESILSAKFSCSGPVK